MRHRLTRPTGLLFLVAVVIGLPVAAATAAVTPAIAAGGVAIETGLTPCEGADAPQYAKTAEALVAQGEKDRAEEIYQAVLFRDPKADCAVRGLAALTQLRSAERSVSGKLGDSWDKSFTKYVQPAISPLLGLVAIAAVGSAVAGLTTSVFTRFKARSRGRSRRLSAEVIGFAVLLAGSLALVAAAEVISARSVGWVEVADAARAWIFPLSLFWTLFLTGLVLLLGGIALYSAALGRRLKLAIEVRDSAAKADQVSAQYLLGRLTAFGSEAPKGLRTPENTDVTSLPESAVSILGVTGVSGALLSLVRSLRRPAPWRATVGLVDASTVVVTLTRNGKAIPNWTMTLHQLGLPPVTIDAAERPADKAWPDAAKRYLLTAAAAYVLLEISRVDDDLRRGLCGAGEAASLAMRLIATDDSARLPDTLTLRLLRRAVAADPASGLALVALLGRRSLSVGEQAAVADDADAAMDRIQHEGEGYAGMRLRLSNILTVTRFNVLLMLRQSRPGAHERIYEAKVGAAQAAITLVDLLRERSREAQDLRRDMRVTGGYLVLDIKSQVGDQFEVQGWGRAVETAQRWVEDTRTTDSVTLPPPLSAQESYARACYECSRQGHADWARRALADLRVAATDNRLRLWAREDPSLEPLRRDSDEPDSYIAQAFQRVVGDPPVAEFFDLSVFAAHRDTIRALGLSAPAELLDLTSEEWATLGVPATVAERWIRIAHLALPEAGRCGVPVDVLDVIIGLGVESRADLAERITTDLQGWHREVLAASAGLAVRPRRSDWAAYAFSPALREHAPA